MTNAAFNRDRADEMATMLFCAGTDTRDQSAVIMLLMNRGFSSATIMQHIDQALRRVATLKRSAAAAFDAHFPIDANHTGASQ